MAISFGVGTAKSTTTAPGRTGDGNLTCTLPSGWSAGQLAILILYSDQGSGSQPTNWSEIAGSPFGTGTPKLQVFTRILQAGDANPVTTISGSGTNLSHCANIATYNNASGIDVIGTASNGTGTPMTAGSINTLVDGAWVLGLCGRGDNENASTQTFGGSATGVTEELDGGTNQGDDSQVSLYDKTIATHGATGNGSAATSATDPWVSVLVSIAPNPPTITNADDEGFYNGQTEVVITGTEFGDSQGTGTVQLNTAANGSGSTQAQTVTDWTDTAITITVNQGALSNGTLYLIVTAANGLSNTGYAVTLDNRPAITDVGDEGVYNGEADIVVTGTDFGDSQGDGFLYLNSAADGSGTNEVQSIVTWSDTSITFDVSQGALTNGTVYIRVYSASRVDMATGYAIILGIRPIITDAGDEGFFDTEAPVVITGTDFTNIQGEVTLNSASDGSGTSVAQTVNNWTDTAITITVNQGALSNGPLYLFVLTGTQIDSTSYTVTLADRPTISTVGDGQFDPGETSITISGTYFYADQDSGWVELNTQADGSGASTTQTITNWSNTSITFTAVQGVLSEGYVYVIVTNDDQVASDGYLVILGELPPESTIANDWHIDYVPNSPLTLSHNDGTLLYDTGAGTLPGEDDYIRGTTSGATARILSVSGTAASGTLTLTDTTARFQNNESLVWMDSIGFDTVTNGGLTVGDVITGASSGRTGTIRYLDYFGTSGTAYSENFGTGTWTDNENIQVSSQTRAQANGVGVDNSGQWTGVLANGTLTPPTLCGIISYDGGTLLIPLGAKVTGVTSTAVGVVHSQYGITSTGSLRLNDISGTWVNNETIRIKQIVYYDNLQGGEEFNVGDWIIGSTSSATGRILQVIDDGDDTGKLILADQVGIFDHTTPDDLEVEGVKIAEVENNTFTLNAATTNGTLYATQSAAKGGLYTTSLNPVRTLNSLYTYLMDTFDELDQLDDLTPLVGLVKNQQYTLQNNWRIPDLSMRFLDSGGIQDETEANIWTNVRTLGTVEGINDDGFASTVPSPQLYVVANNALVPTFWIEGHINVLIKVKTSTLATLDDSEGQLMNNGQLTVYARRYTHSYDNYTISSVGGVAYAPLGTNQDISNLTGTHSLSYDNEANGPFLVGERIATSGNAKTGVITALTDNGTTGTIEYNLTSSSNLNNNEVITGAKSGASADVNGAPTNLVAGFTDITFTFGATEQNLFNGAGLQPYDCVVDCNNRSLSEVYEYLKYVTREGSTTTLNGNDGYEYQAVGDIKLNYDSQTGDFTEGLTVTGANSDATGIIVSDHNTNPTRALTLRNVSGNFLDSEVIADTATGLAAINGATVTIQRVKASPFGTMAGIRFFGARGVWLSNIPAGDANNYELIDSEGVRQVPPQTIALTVNGLEISDRVSIFRTTGDNEIIKRDVYTSHNTNNVLGDDTFDITTPIDDDTPTSGILRVVDNSLNKETRYAYTSWSGSTFSGITPTLAVTYDNTDTAYVPYLDTTADATSESVSVTYQEDRYVLTVVRVTGIQPFKVKGQVTASGLSVTAIRTSDSIYQ